MKIGFFSVSSDQMFTNPNTSSGSGDELLLPMVRLAEEGEREGVECLTVDMAGREEFDAFVFCEMPEPENEYFSYAKEAGKPVYLLIFENSILWKSNADVSRYTDFDVVFTYDDSVVDGERVVKQNYAFDLPRTSSTSTEHKSKLAVMICSNQRYDKKNMLYTARRETIQWFEENQPEHFDLYGLGWHKGTLAFQTHPVLQKRLRRMGLLWLFPCRKYPSWKGAVTRKRDVLGNYRFGFCYENTTLIPGYITEKIFDVMMAGTVPVYLGAANAGDHIPKDCFVNRADFADHESLYKYLSEMPDEEYGSYLKRINEFLSSEQSAPFSISTFIQRLLSAFKVSA